ncbi:MAG: hypothetical protein Q4C52_13660 [Eubacteriales bacterium]|nr:hypothetical protein [Eubacteriales bacterium]
MNLLNLLSVIAIVLKIRYTENMTANRLGRFRQLGEPKSELL